MQDPDPIFRRFCRTRDPELLAQVFDVNIGWAGMLLIVVTAVGASIGSPATPGVGIVVLAMVLDSVGIPTVGIALIMGVDRILDMCRTAVNVCGDIVACALMQRWMPPREGQPEALRSPRRAPMPSTSMPRVLVANALCVIKTPRGAVVLPEEYWI